MKTKTGFLSLLFLILVSCSNTKNDSSEKFIQYLKNVHKIAPSRTDYFLIINCRGCMGCEEAAYEYYSTHNTLWQKIHGIISLKFLDRMEDDLKLTTNKMSIDSNDVIEGLNLPFNGVTFVRLEDSKIIEIRNLSPQSANQDSLSSFFCIR